VPFVAGRHEVPTCWTGKSLDSSNHKDHMAYMTDFSTCPDYTHPCCLN
jgi:hypothetical protein